MKITGAAAVLPVRDLEVSLRYFTEVLRFTLSFRVGQYAGLQRDDGCLHLSAHGNPNTGTPGTGAVYLFCDAVDDYFAEIVQRGAITDGSPKSYDYGMRDFIARDPDGNQLTFGAPSEAS